jgi:Protein of unknown function (DUF3089)
VDVLRARTGTIAFAVAMAGALCIALTVAGAAEAKTVWLCKPGQSPNPCHESLQTTIISSSGASSVIDPPLARRPKIDCFYVYPTVSDQTTTNADLTVDPEQTAIARYQASRFSQRCRVFAPMYRQLTLTGISGGTLPASAVQLAYGDVAAAWTEYMRKYNKGRGVVLIGHSQGTGMLTRLIQQKIDRFRGARRRLVSALLLGGNVTVKQGSDVGGAFDHVRACHSKKQRHCVVAYSTFNAPPPDDTAFGRPSGALVDAFGGAQPTDTEVLCNNPAALGGGFAPLQTLVPTSSFPGTLGLGIRISFNGTPPTAPTPWVSPQDHYTAICQHSNGANVLMIYPVGSARTLIAVPDATWGLHLADANIALGNLVNLVRTQSRAYLAAKAKRRRRAVRHR